MLLTTENLTINFGGLTAVNRFSMDIASGEIVGLIGPNGAGKTTIFNMLTAVYRPSSGKICFQGRDISNLAGQRRLTPDVITRLGIARTFQNIRLFGRLSVYDNVLIAHHLHLRSTYPEAILRLPRYRREIRDFCTSTEKLLASLGLSELKNEQADSLPYGQQRRLEIARALATRPQLLLLDEPAAGMNPQEGQDLMGFIRHIRDEYQLTILMIEHDMKVVMGVCERIYVLDHGMEIATGLPEEIKRDKKVIAAYLGVSEDAES